VFKTSYRNILVRPGYTVTNENKMEHAITYLQSNAIFDKKFNFLVKSFDLGFQ
jgi:hypothetical protein